MTPTELGARIAIPLLLGALIGFERQWHRRLAGLRTNALVAIGSAGFVIIGVWRPIWHRARLFAKLSKIPVIVRAA
jgi:uncharacterized membrane protein YhiD involved in acid resistance